MRQSKLGQRPAKIGALQAICRYTVGSADNKYQVLTDGLPLIQKPCKSLAGKFSATFVENNNEFCGPDLCQNFFTFGVFRYCGCHSFVALRRTNGVKTKLPLTRQSLHVAIEC